MDYNACKTTSLDNLGRVCRWHHDLISYEGYVLGGGPGAWELRAPPEGAAFETATPTPTATPSATGPPGETASGSHTGGSSEPEASPSSARSTVRDRHRLTRAHSDTG